MKKCEICDGEMKVSKKGNLYCSNICWKDKKYESLREAKKLENIAYECTMPNIN